MKITQVSYYFVKDHMHDSNIYRLLVCDDGNYGHHHQTIKIKPVKNLTVDELAKSADNDNAGFVLIVPEEE